MCVCVNAPLRNVVHILGDAIFTCYGMKVQLAMSVPTLCKCNCMTIFVGIADMSYAVAVRLCELLP